MSSTVVGGLFALGAGSALAQTAAQPAPEAAPAPAPAPAAPAPAAPAPAAPEGSTVREVVVTGSRIPRPNLTSVSPITAVSSQEIRYQGATDVTEVVNYLPQAQVGLTNTPNPLTNGLGYTTANLRGLGATRTLVLMDGKRLAPGDPTLGGDVPDLDTIPTQLVDRIEVVTGGASAVYGSDAVAGVINFIMKRNFEGAQLDMQYGIAQHDNGNIDAQNAVNALFPGTAPTGTRWDGRTITAALTVGANSPDGKGNVTAYFAYKNQEPIRMSERDFADCLLQSNGTRKFCSGSANSNYLGDANVVGTNSFQVVGGAGHNKFVPWGSAGQSSIPPQFFNSSPFQFLSRQETRYQAGFFSHYDYAPWAQLYTQFTFTHDSSQEFIAPGGSFLGDLYQVNCDNPFLNGNVGPLGVVQSQASGKLTCLPSPLFAAGVATIQLGRRDIEGGPRESFYQHDSWREVIGLKGQLSEAWSYDLSGQYSQTDYLQTTSGFFSKRNLQEALFVQNVGGVPTCVASDATTGSGLCRPYNPFVEGNGGVQLNPINGVTQAALNFVEVPSILQGQTTEQIMNINFVGLLGKYGIQSPWATEGVGVSVGAEYRREFLTEKPDEENAINDLAGGSGIVPPVEGAYDVKEWYAELRLPVVQDHDWAKDLTAELGWRRADYSLAGTVDAYKAAAEWAPTSDIRFRASFQRAVRAPNVNELFFPEVVTQTAVLSTDPCSGAAPSATLQQCERTGVTPAQYGTIHDCPANQCAAAVGGNRGLKPEKSDTTSLGFIFTPTFLRNFNLSVDYFNITVNQAISTIPVNTTVSECLSTGDPLFCQLIHRNAQGQLWGDNSLATGGYVVGINENIGFLKTAGIDFESNYRLRIEDLGWGDYGALSFNLIGTFLQKFVNEPIPGLGSYDCAGLFGPTCATLNGANPQWRHKLRMTWSTPWRFELSTQWRFLSGQTLENFTSNPLLQSPTTVKVAGVRPPDFVEKEIPNFNYFDVTATYKVSDRLTLRAGVNNILDKDPPWLAASITGTGSPNSFPLYDLEGRMIFANLTANW